MRGIAVSIALLVVLLPLAGTSWAGTATAPFRYLVGYDPANEQAAHLAIEAAGGDVARSSSEIGFALVFTQSESFDDVARASPWIHYVEVDDATQLAGAQWNGAQWNGAQWNGAQWNGAQWNGAQWNGAQWNDAGLAQANVDQRNAAKWTESHYQSEPGNKMKWAGESTDPGLVWQWAHWASDANHAWTAGALGARRASVCVLDSGVAWDHADIAPNYVAGYNAMDPSASAYDDGGHGTHIAGIAAGRIADAYGIAGVGNLQILNAKVLDAQGAGHESDLAFGLVWCAQQDAEVAVMALSVTDADHPTLRRAIDHAAARDVLLLASAGNSGGAVAFPASDPKVMAVSAVDGNLTLAAFSSRGSDVELAAPGVSILGAFPGGQFVFGSGTSQAVAYAAGAAGLVRDLDGALSASQTRALLKATAIDLGSAGPDALYGSGLVQVDLAAQQALAP